MAQNLVKQQVCWFSTTLLNMCDVKDVGYDDVVALHGRCSVKLQQMCLRTRYTIQSNMPHGPLEIKEKNYLTDASPSDMPTNNVKDCYIVNTTYMSCKELLCRCNIYACWPSVTVTNTAAVQTCLLVECCCKMVWYLTISRAC